MTKVLSLLLIVSLALNMYLLIRLSNLEELNTKLHSSEQVSANANARSTQQTKNKTDNRFVNTSNATQQNKGIPSQLANENKERLSKAANDAYEAPQELQSEDLLLLLEELQAAKQYADMVLPLREYLKLYPNDYRAWLIEADLIFHTEPLNVAVAYYYSLLDKNIPDVEKKGIVSLIKVNTNNVIKQLTGDGAWELLATFLEPLIQIDPLNNRYLLALARAYGEQEQFALMENALAGIRANDIKVQKLRLAMYQRAEARANGNVSDSSDEDSLADAADELLDDTVSLSKRKVNVFGANDQFFVRTRFGRRSVSLLLDTGASTTAIKQSVFERIPSKEKEFIGYFTVQTAGGNIQAPLYRLESIMLDRIEVNNVSVIILPNENLKGPMAGLLGMNVLRAFELRFDPEEQRMTLLER